MAHSREEIEKKRAIRRKKARKRRIVTGFIFFILLSLSVTAALAVTVLFPVKKVNVSGSKLYTQKQLINAAGITDKDNVLSVSAGDIEKRMRKELSYIDTVKLERILPDTVKITVSDAKESACFFFENAYFAVSDKGYVLNRYDAPPENTYTVYCNDVECKIGNQVKYKTEDESETVNKLSDCLKKEKINVNRIDVTDKVNLKARVEGRFDVSFGSDTDIEKKCSHLAAMIKSIDNTRTGKINLSMWTSSKSEGSFNECALE